MLRVRISFFQKSKFISWKQYINLRKDAEEYQRPYFSLNINYMPLLFEGLYIEPWIINISLNIFYFAKLMTDIPKPILIFLKQYYHPSMDSIPKN